MPLFIKKFLNTILLFFIRGAFSDKDIQKLLGTHVFIYPFKKENLKGASYNLTASRFAFVFDRKKDGSNGKELLIIDDKDNINIPGRSTAIIETNESIYVPKGVCGTYHSRVKLVNKGLGHIGTTLDPCYFGPSAIALHNINDKPISIKVGDPIVSIMFYSLRSRSSGEHDNLPGRQDVLSLNLTVDDFYDKNLDISNVYTIIKGKVKDKCKKSIIKNILGEVNIDNFMCSAYNSSTTCNRCQFILSEMFKINNKKKEIIIKINKWRDKPWINNKENLIKTVVKYVKIRDFSKDIVIGSVFWVLIGMAIMVVSFYNIVHGNAYEYIKSTYRTIMGIVPPTIAIIIGIMVHYKEGFIKNKWE